MKIFVEVMKHLIVECPSFLKDEKITYGIDGKQLPLGKADMGYIVKTKTEHSTMIKAQKALKEITLLSDDKKRIHVCYHNDKNKPCEIINE
jgi:phage major head subunit gpT-like protein